MCSSLLYLAAGSRDLSQTKKRIIAMQTIFAQNDNFVHPGQFWMSFCDFAQLFITVILFSVWDKSRDPGAS